LFSVSIGCIGAHAFPPPGFAFGPPPISQPVFFLSFDLLFIPVPLTRSFPVFDHLVCFHSLAGCTPRTQNLLSSWLPSPFTSNHCVVMSARASAFEASTFPSSSFKTRSFEGYGSGWISFLQSRPPPSPFRSFGPSLSQGQPTSPPSVITWLWGPSTSVTISCFAVISRGALFF